MILSAETNCELIDFILFDNFTFSADFKIINIFNFIINLGFRKLGKLFKIETFFI